MAAKGKTHYTQVLPDYLTHPFQTIRDELGIEKHLPVRERPSFHEIRSLGIALYKQQGTPP